LIHWSGLLLKIAENELLCRYNASNENSKISSIRTRSAMQKTPPSTNKSGVQKKVKSTEAEVIHVVSELEAINLSADKVASHLSMDNNRRVTNHFSITGIY
jgi:hypothetical protein